MSTITAIGVNVEFEDELYHVHAETDKTISKAEYYRFDWDASELGEWEEIDKPDGRTRLGKALREARDAIWHAHYDNRTDK